MLVRVCDGELVRWTECNTISRLSVSMLRRIHPAQCLLGSARDAALARTTASSWTEMPSKNADSVSTNVSVHDRLDMTDSRRTSDADDDAGDDDDGEPEDGPPPPGPADDAAADEDADDADAPDGDGGVAGGRKARAVPTLGASVQRREARR